MGKRTILHGKSFCVEECERNVVWEFLSLRDIAKRFVANSVRCCALFQLVHPGVEEIFKSVCDPSLCTLHGASLSRTLHLIFYNTCIADVLSSKCVRKVYASHPQKIVSKNTYHTARRAAHDRDDSPKTAATMGLRMHWRAWPMKYDINQAYFTTDVEVLADDIHWWLCKMQVSSRKYSYQGQVWRIVVSRNTRGASAMVCFRTDEKRSIDISEAERPFLFFEDVQMCHATHN